MRLNEQRLAELRTQSAELHTLAALHDEALRAVALLVEKARAVAAARAATDGAAEDEAVCALHAEADALVERLS